MSAQKSKAFSEISSVFFWRCVLAEFLASTIYTFIVCTASLNIFQTSPISDQLSAEWAANPTYVMKVALAAGFAVTSIAYMFEMVNGGFINPAITFAALASWRISLLRAVLYLLVQFAGGITGVAIIYAITPADYRSNLGLPQIGRLSVWQAFGMEGVLVIIVAMTFLAGIDKHRKNADSFGPALAYGFATVAVHLIGISYTGCALNPVRVLGSCVLGNKWPTHIWVYWAGPLAGGVVAGVIYALVFSVAADDDESSDGAAPDFHELPSSPALPNTSRKAKRRTRHNPTQNNATGRFSSTMMYVNTNI